MSQPQYQTLLSGIRQAFPQPVSDRMHDAYFVFSILRALDQVDAKKSEVPVLGHLQELDYRAVEKLQMEEAGSSIEAVTRQLVDTLDGLPI